MTKRYIEVKTNGIPEYVYDEALMIGFKQLAERYRAEKRLAKARKVMRKLVEKKLKKMGVKVRRQS